MNKSLFPQGAYHAYSYAYPHKTAYRALEPRPLAQVWQGERLDHLFLYVHIPFCEMRCGFCNLFTESQPQSTAIEAHQAALFRHIEATNQAFPEGRFSQMAIGGGTPTLLSVSQLEALFEKLNATFGVAGLPCSIETSPQTATPDKLSLLASHGVERISLGVQSFDHQDAKHCGRPQKPEEVFQALDNIRKYPFNKLNIDLIYGIDGQTPDTWLHTLKTALHWQPEEIYCYPLYVRPLTGLGKRDLKRNASQDHAQDHEDWDAQRLRLYTLARDFLHSEGYTQVSMRMFQKIKNPSESQPNEYACQRDGMVGVGCGARSYTRELHYSSEFAVSQRGVKAILAAYAQRDFSSVEYGLQLNAEEQRRRWLIQMLLPKAGLNIKDYTAHFGGNILEDFPSLQRLIMFGYVLNHENHLCLSPEGMAYSDAIGPYFYSLAMQIQMQGFDLR
jgi:oxygen-independent coproporphyrinogen-3 oxidase